MTKGETLTLTATVTAEAGAMPSLMWSSTNSTVISVTNQGVITALNPGTATIYVRISGASNIEDTYTITVKPAATCNIIFDAAGGDVEGENTRVTGADGKLTSLPTATREGYTFKGWFTEAAGGTQITTDTVFTADMTVYAQWTEHSTHTPSVGGGSSSHSCTSKCRVCGGCEDLSCSRRVCKAKCILLTMDFTDVEDAWYTEAVEYACHHGLMGGYGDGVFHPNGTVTRQQVWMILARMSGEDPADMAEARAWAIESSVSDGTSPTAAITRQQLVTMLWRCARDRGFDVSMGEDTNILSYTDALSISEYAVPAMQWACGEGIISGYDDGSLRPHATATRAHAAAMVARFIDCIA